MCGVYLHRLISNIIPAEAVQSLLGSDAERAAILFEQAHQLWSLPLQLAVGIGLVYHLVRRSVRQALASALIHGFVRIPAFFRNCYSCHLCC